MELDEAMAPMAILTRGLLDAASALCEAAREELLHDLLRRADSLSWFALIPRTMKSSRTFQASGA